MIVLDIETSGIYPERHGIWQIGALELENPSNVFLEEGRIDDEDVAEEEAGKVHGKNEAYLRNSEKQSQRELIEKLFNWAGKVKIITVICQNPQFDLGFIRSKAEKYGINNPFHRRSFDLHSFASLKYYQIYGKFLMEENHSGMGLTNILEFCGVNYERRAHNALEDAELTAECFSRIVYGRSLFPKYNRFSIPKELGGTKE